MRFASSSHRICECLQDVVRRRLEQIGRRDLVRRIAGRRHLDARSFTCRERPLPHSRSQRGLDVLHVHGEHCPEAIRSLHLLGLTSGTAWDEYIENMSVFVERGTWYMLYDGSAMYLPSVSPPLRRPPGPGRNGAATP